MAVSASTKAALESAFSGLVSRLVAQGYTEAQAIAAAQAQITARIADNATVDAGVSATAIVSVAGAKRMVQAAVDQLVGGAGAALDTIHELAAALQGNPNIVGELTDLIGTKETPAGAQAKVDALAATVVATYATKAELSAAENAIYADLQAMFEAAAQ